MRLLLAAFLLCCLWSCGYIGPVVPPSPEIPYPIKDLAVVERGDQLIITFTAPPSTTDAIAIQRFSDIDLRIGPAVIPFDFERWAAAAKQYEIPLPEENDPDAPRPIPIRKTLPASEWQGQKIEVAVRTAVKKGKHYSSWSNRVGLEVIPPLPVPQVKRETMRLGYKLTWAEATEGASYEIQRQGPGEKVPVSIGVAEKPEYVDTTSQWDTPYTYTVIAKKGAAESLPSAATAANAPDTFAPSVPANVVALAGPDSVEITWTRSPEADTKGYYLYRSTQGGAFERQGDLVALPTFSDRRAEHGKTYRYAVSAVDQKGNVSENSTPVEVAF